MPPSRCVCVCIYMTCTVRCLLAISWSSYFRADRSLLCVRGILFCVCVCVCVVIYRHNYVLCVLTSWTRNGLKFSKRVLSTVKLLFGDCFCRCKQKRGEP